jgi:hypothetical protein
MVISHVHFYSNVSILFFNPLAEVVPQYFLNQCDDESVVRESQTEGNAEVVAVDGEEDVTTDMHIDGDHHSQPSNVTSHGPNILHIALGYVGSRDEVAIERTEVSSVGDARESVNEAK